MGMNRGQGRYTAVDHGGAEISAGEANIAEQVIVELQQLGIHPALGRPVENGRDKGGHFSLSFLG